MFIYRDEFYNKDDARSRASPRSSSASSATARPARSSSRSSSRSPSSPTLVLEPEPEHEEVARRSTQVIWLGADATDYAVHCEACEEDRSWPRMLHPTLVEGRLARTPTSVSPLLPRPPQLRVPRRRLRVVAPQAHRRQHQHGAWHRAEHVRNTRAR